MAIRYLKILLVILVGLHARLVLCRRQSRELELRYAATSALVLLFVNSPER